jgi:hypothetical protein
MILRFLRRKLPGAKRGRRESTSIRSLLDGVYFHIKPMWLRGLVVLRHGIQAKIKYDI